MIREILSCDWGTSSFRLRHVSLSGKEILAEISSDHGIAEVYNQWLQTGKKETGRLDFYKHILQQQLQIFPSLDKSIPIIISGMASSSIGIKAIDYGKVPFNIKTGTLHTEFITADKNFDRMIILVSGLRTTEDVMRGEETMLAGLDLPDQKALVIIPGTHSKHVQIENNVVIDFKTYMSGEMFDLLATKSVLAQSVLKNDSDRFNDNFKSGVKDGATGNLLNNAFHVRTNQVFQQQTPEANYHYLSGLVIGTELKDLITDEHNIHLVSTTKFKKLYLSAIDVLLPARRINFHDADEALVNGHCRLAQLLQ